MVVNDVFCVVGVFSVICAVVFCLVKAIEWVSRVNRDLMRHAARHRSHECTTGALRADIQILRSGRDWADRQIGDLFESNHALKNRIQALESEKKAKKK